jgi:thiol:disulfide interchange protein DsbD
MEKAILPFKKYFTLYLSAATSVLSAGIVLEQSVIHDQEAEIIFRYTLEKDEYLYEESLQLHAEPAIITVKKFFADPSPRIIYDTKMRRDVAVFKNTGTLHYTLTLPTKIPAESSVFLHYRSNTRAKPGILVAALSPAKNSAHETSQRPTIAHPVALHIEHPSITSATTAAFQEIIRYLSDTLTQIQEAISYKVMHTTAIFPRLMLVLILGLLMSFTPCIYPMIPITVGILQASAGNSFVRNATLALAYTVGMASTFATLGFLAATGSAQFGALLGNTYFVAILVLFLAYLAGTMLGLYELWMPQFMNMSVHTVRGGSYISVFIFGALSGTFASPCLSPGLLLLLSIVATLGNPYMGFLLLFAFGMGLGIPLLIVGTFSNSLNVMPRAGIWMLEAKKIFGVLLLSMCFYYLSFIVPLYTIWALVAFCLFALGVAAIISMSPADTAWFRRYKAAVGMLLIIAACATVPPLLRALITAPDDHGNWATSYTDARAQARTEKKFLFADFGAAWCSSCTTLKRAVLDTPVVSTVLNKTIPVYIDCTNPTHESCATVQKKFGVKGYPTVLLIDPETETIRGQWGSELLNKKPEFFAQELETLITQ